MRRLPQLRPAHETNDEFEKEYLELQDLRSPSRQIPMSNSTVSRQNQYEIQLRQQIQDIANAHDFTAYLVRRNDFENELLKSREQPDAVKLYVGIAGQILKLLDPYDSGAVTALGKIIDYLVSEARMDPLELQNARKNNKLLQQHISQLSKTLQQKEIIIKEKTEQAKELSQKLQKANDRIQNLEINIISLNGQIEKQLKLINSQNDQLDELSKKALEQQNIIAEMVKQKNDLLNDNMRGKQLLEENHLLQKQLENKMKQIQQDANEKLKDAERQIAQATLLKDEADRIQGSTKDQIERMKKQLKEQEDEYAALQRKMEMNQETINKMKQRIQQQTAQLAQQSQDLKNTKQKLAEQDEKHLREKELEKRQKQGKEAEANAKKAKEAADEIEKLKKQIQQLQSGKSKKGKGKGGEDDNDSDNPESSRYKSSKGKGRLDGSQRDTVATPGSRNGRNSRLVYQKETYDHGAAAWLYENMPENDKVVYVNTAGAMNYTVCKHCNKLINENSSGLRDGSLELSHSDDQANEGKKAKKQSPQDQLRNVSAESLKLSTQAQALMNKINAHIDFFKNNNIDMTEDDVKKIQQMQGQLNDLTFKLTTIDLERSRLLKQVPTQIMKRMNMISSIGSQVLQLDDDMQILSINSSMQLVEPGKTSNSPAGCQNSILQSKHMGSYRLHNQKAINSITTGLIANELEKDSRSFVKSLGVLSDGAMSPGSSKLNENTLTRSLPTNLEELKQEDLIGIITDQQQKYEEEVKNNSYLREFMTTEMREGDVKIEFQKLNKEMIDTVENMQARIEKMTKPEKGKHKLQRTNTELQINDVSQLFVPKNSIVASQSHKIKNQPYTTFEQRVNDFLINTIEHITYRDPKFTRKRALMKQLLKQYGKDLLSEEEVVQLEKLLESEQSKVTNNTEASQYSLMNGDFKSPLYGTGAGSLGLQGSQQGGFDMEDLQKKLDQLEQLQKIAVKTMSDRERMIAQLANLNLDKKSHVAITPAHPAIIHQQNDEDCVTMHYKQIILTHGYPARRVSENRYISKAASEEPPPILDDIINYQQVMQVNVLQEQIFKAGTAVRYISADLFRKNVLEHFTSNGISVIRNGSSEFIEIQVTIREKQFAMEQSQEIMALFKQQILNSFDKPMLIQEMLISYYQIKYGIVYLKYYFQTVCNLLNYQNSDLLIHICCMLVFNKFYNRYLQYFTVFMLNNIEQDLTYDQAVELFDKTMVLTTSQLKEFKSEFKKISTSGMIPKQYLIIKAYNTFLSKINDLENQVYDAYSSQNSNNSNELLLEVNPLYRDNIDTLTAIRSLTYVLNYEQFCCFNKRVQFFSDITSKKQIMDTLQYLYGVLNKEEEYIDRQKHVLDEKQQNLFREILNKIHKVSQIAKTLIENKLHQMAYIILVQFSMLILQANTMLYIDRIQAQ